METNVHGEGADLHATYSDVEQRLSSTLMVWAVSSVVVGVAAAALGKARSHPAMAAFGRQTAGWGAVDGLIAAAGIRSRRRRGELDAESAAAKSRSLRRLLVINSIADVGYIAAGATIIARDRTGRRTARMGVGDGVAIVIQGTFLLALDASQALRLPQ